MTRSEKKTSEEAEADLGNCASRVFHGKWHPGLELRKRDGMAQGFQYGHMSLAIRDATNVRMVLEFLIPDKWRVTIEGLNLKRIFSLVLQHRLEWLQEGSSAETTDGPVEIERISIEPVEEEKPSKR